MKKILVIIGIVVLVIIGFYTVLNATTDIKEELNDIPAKISVVTTLFPQYDFTKEIGGNKVDVVLLLLPGVEAHAYEPKLSDITRINNADIFVYTGEFMEPWVSDVIESVDEKVKIVDVSVGIKMIKEDEEHEHEGADPHIWLDFENAKIIVESISQSLSEVDPQNAEYYQKNLKIYQDKLTKLDNDYKNTLSNCKTRKIIYGGHYAFGYMAERYNLEYSSAQGFSPDAEPSVKDMIALTEQIKKNNIGYIFYEELTSPKIAETLSEETDAKLLLLNSAHNLTKKNYESGTSFILIMEENLKNLSLGLNCQK